MEGQLCLSSLQSRARPTAPAAAQQRREHPGPTRVTSSHRLTTGHAMQTCAAAHGSLLARLSPSCDLKPGMVIILSSSRSCLAVPWCSASSPAEEWLLWGHCPSTQIPREAHIGQGSPRSVQTTLWSRVVLCRAVCDRARICQHTHQPPTTASEPKGCTCWADLVAAALMQKITELLLRSAGLQLSVIVKSLPDQLHREPELGALGPIGPPPAHLSHLLLLGDSCTWRSMPTHHGE